ncbi:MAG: cell envelope integrity protein CreD [Kiritimatiellia bacterium]
MDANENPGEVRLPFFKRFSVIFKMAGVLSLVLVLLIPLAMIKSLINERMFRRNAALAEITSTWGSQETIVGPVLVVPYEYKTKKWKDQMVRNSLKKIEVEETALANAYLLPAQLEITGDVSPEKLHRGIYEAVVYKGRLDLSGSFAPSDLAVLGIAAEAFRWGEARISLAVTDLRGSGEILKIKTGDTTGAFAPGCLLPGYSSGIHAGLPGIKSAPTNLAFQMMLDLKGSQGLRFAPLGRQNRVKLGSAWPDPSFCGAFLPAERAVDARGFNATWQVSWYGRSYPQTSTDRGGEYAFKPEAISPSLFGVEFLAPVDSYRMVERASKYGVLFIALIFTAFFLFEILSGLRLHAFQYALVGAALCLFYLAMLSLSEFIRFVYAYWAGVAASSILVILYCLRALRGGKRTAVIAAMLLSVFTYLYVVLQMQEYSLLFGSAGLFLILGIVMFVTRNVDWYARE